MFCLHLCLCNIRVPGAHGGERRALSPLELELWMVMDCYIGAEKPTQPLQEQPVLLTLNHRSILRATLSIVCLHATYLL